MNTVVSLSSNHPKYRPVRRLDVSKSNITDLGLESLARLETLEHLNVTGTKVTEGGLRQLEKTLPNCQIVGP